MARADDGKVYYARPPGRNTVAHKVLGLDPTTVPRNATRITGGHTPCGREPENWIRIQRKQVDEGRFKACTHCVRPEGSPPRYALAPTGRQGGTLWKNKPFPPLYPPPND